MKRNVGLFDRALRALGAAGFATCSVMAPLPVEVRLPLFGGLAFYLGFTALAGLCFGYALTGRSTCAVDGRG
jgi:hypothetical protein